MSWGTCYSGSNNIHFNFPAFMDDGRNFSNYEAGATLDNIIKKKENITSNSDYRHYLQKNADSIIKNNQLNACDQCGTCPYINNDTNNQQLNGSPYIFNSILSNDQPYGYENSDLKNLYLSKQQLDAKLHAPRFKVTQPLNLEENRK